MAMATFTHATIRSEGLNLALALAEEMMYDALADFQDVFDTPVIHYMGDVAGRGSSVLRDRFIGWGWTIEMGTTAAEDTDVTATAVSGSSADVTVARRALRHDETQMAQIIDGATGFDPAKIAQAQVASFRAGRMGILGDTIAGASTNITAATTGDVDDLFDILDSFEDSTAYDGPLFGLYRPPTFQSIRDSVRSEVGPFKERGDFQRVADSLGAQLMLGIMIFKSTRVTSAAAKYENAVMMPGAIGYAIGSTSSVRTMYEAERPAGLPMVIDFAPNPSAAGLEIVANGYDGLAIREQGRIRGHLADT